MRAVFLDRDGVINENRADHVKTWSEFRFLPGAIEAITRLSQTNLRIFIITNQAIINRKVVTRETVDAINEQMVRIIERHGGRIDGVACCPHRVDERCGCRKPQPGLLLEMARKHNLDLSQAILFGDALTDIEAATAAGCKSCLVLTGRGHEQLALASGRNGFAVAPDLLVAVETLLRKPAVAV
jgi:D-glycero-D-manno-heptose 1,7-bisphosphate phosphatase